MPESIFTQFNLPNPTTWFYFSFLLAVALFFKFSRLLSMRNLDLLLLFLPMPGLLLLLESDGDSVAGFITLLGVSVVLLARCLFDLGLERRPALSPNLSPGGLGWLAVALFVSLIAIAVRQPETKDVPERRSPPVASRLEREGERQLDRLPIPDERLATATTRTLAVTCHLAVVLALVFIGWRHFHDLHSGMATATFYLLLPY